MANFGDVYVCVVAVMVVWSIILILFAKVDLFILSEKGVLEKVLVMAGGLNVVVSE